MRQERSGSQREERCEEEEASHEEEDSCSSCRGRAWSTLAWAFHREGHHRGTESGGGERARERDF